MRDIIKLLIFRDDRKLFNFRQHQSRTFDVQTLVVEQQYADSTWNSACSDAWLKAFSAAFTGADTVGLK